MGDDIDWLDLPGRWTYGVCGDGRIFFINDDTESTSWVHPGTGYAIQSGHFSCAGFGSSIPHSCFPWKTR
ncbi:hypothetical protein DV515_00016570 [Chloebia gouldiae]|uniref:WW domain-containing protein n=1 Tax=Chloebia gouldiae TaxID=44316 RepID=A0A3L8RTJ0_CHLGU|nr:hypothetical protein DV515_00016570 [Chloebia gouldiae]